MGLGVSYQSWCQQILDDFEVALRAFICAQLNTKYGDRWWRTKVPGAVRKLCQERIDDQTRRPFPKLPQGQPIDYTHIGELKDIITRGDNYGEVFRGFFGPDSSGIRTKLEELSATRDAVRHVRPGLGQREFDWLRVTCADLFDAMKLEPPDSIRPVGEPGPRFQGTESEVDEELSESLPELHLCHDNLPRPDYSTFFGRSEERTKILEYIDHPRAWGISVDGIGGVGKTALALNCAYALREMSNGEMPPFEYIIWASAKTERLAPRGIVNVLPSFSDLDTLLNVVLEETGFQASMSAT